MISDGSDAGTGNVYFVSAGAKRFLPSLIGQFDDYS